jgi:cytidylate kinase
MASRVSAYFGVAQISMGNLFRALSCDLRARGIPVDATDRITQLLDGATLEFRENQGTWTQIFNGIEESPRLRTTDATRDASLLAANTAVHKHMTQLVRNNAGAAHVVMEGRAIGSYVLSSADVKIYLDASIEARVERTLKREPGQDAAALRKTILERDARDQGRAHAPLKRTDRHIYVDSSSLSIEETFAQIRAVILDHLATAWFQARVDSLRQTCDEASCQRMVEEMATYCAEYPSLRDRRCAPIAGIEEIGLRFYNVLAARIANDSDRRTAWERCLHAVPELVEAASAKGFFALENFVCGAGAAKDAWCEELARAQAARRPLTTIEPSGRAIEDAELVLLVKPPVASDPAAVSNIVRRIQLHGWEIARLKVFSGEYFQQHAETITDFYREASAGFHDRPPGSAVLEKIMPIYDVPAFEFLFGEAYSDALVFPAESLIARYGVSADTIAELWEFGRRDISAEQFQRWFELDAVVRDASGLRLEKRGRVLIVPPVEPARDHDRWQWFNANACFSLNKIGRSRSAFAVKHPRVRDGRPTIILNGHVLGLMRLFTETKDTVTVAMALARGARASSIGLLRKYLSGDKSNPFRCEPGSIRRDAATGHLRLPFDHGDKAYLNGLKNVLHLSDSSLEGMAELSTLFDIAAADTKVGRALRASGAQPQRIEALARNEVRDDSGSGVFERCSSMEAAELVAYVARLSERRTGDPQARQ